MDCDFLWFFFALQVHAIFLTPGLLERGDVCDIRAAETSHDGSESQQHSHTVTVTVRQKADVVAQWCCLHISLLFLASLCIFQLRVSMLDTFYNDTSLTGQRHVLECDHVLTDRACLIRCFFSGESFSGNWMSKVRMRSPLREGSWDSGIPSPVTTFLYTGLML